MFTKSEWNFVQQRQEKCTKRHYLGQEQTDDTTNFAHILAVCAWIV